MYTVIWMDDYGAYDEVGTFDSLADARKFAEDYEDRWACDPFADGCIVVDVNGEQC